jgi:hypothetical protein
VGHAHASQAFAVTALALAGTALIAGVSAYLATYGSTAVDRDAD